MSTDETSSPSCPEEGRELSSGEMGVSRRDFLRRAGRDAVSVGMQASPTNLAKAAVGLGAKTPWWQKLAAWRKDKTEEETETKEDDERADAK